MTCSKESSERNHGNLEYISYNPFHKYELYNKRKQAVPPV